MPLLNVALQNSLSCTPSTGTTCSRFPCSSDVLALYETTVLDTIAKAALRQSMYCVHEGIEYVQTIVQCGLNLLVGAHGEGCMPKAQRRHRTQKPNLQTCRDGHLFSLLHCSTSGDLSPPSQDRCSPRQSHVPHSRTAAAAAVVYPSCTWAKQRRTLSNNDGIRRAQKEAEASTTTTGQRSNLFSSYFPNKRASLMGRLS